MSHILPKIDDKSFRFSVGKNTYDNQPRQYNVASFGEFCEFVANTRSPKKGMTFVCAPMAYGKHDDPAKHPGEANYRLTSHCESRRYLSLDFDGFKSRETFTQLLTLMEQFSAIAYTTASHTEDNPRARAMLELSRPVSREEGILLGEAFQAQLEKELGTDAIEFDDSVYRGEQPCYTPVTTSELWRFNGKPLNVDEHLGDYIPAQTAKSDANKANDELASNDLLEGPGNIAVVKEMLAVIPSAKREGCDRSMYLAVIWALCSLDWERGEQLAREWCLKSPDDFDESDFVRDWNSYDPNRPDGIGFGTLFHYAQKFGYVAPGAVEKTVSVVQAAIEEWPTPTPLPPKYPETPRLDPAILPESIGSYAADCANRLQVPAEMIVTPLLIGLGSIIGKKLAVQPRANDDSWSEFPNLWGATVAPPAMLKSPAMSAGLRFIQELEDAAMRQHAVEMVNWDSDKRLRELEAETNRGEAKKAIKIGDTERARACLDKNAEVAPPARKRYIVNDTTPEALHEIFLANPNGVMCVVDELDGYVRRLDRDGYESARAQDLQQFDGKQDAASDRIKRGSSVAEGPRKAMFGNLQPTKIERYLRETEHNNDGYLQRLLQLGIQPTFDRAYKLIDAEPDREAEEQCRAIFAAVDALPLPRSELTGRIQPRIVKFTESAQAHFNGFLVGLENRVRSGQGNSILASHIGKYRGTLPKLALIVAVAENPSVTRIGLATLKRAESLLGFYTAHAKRIYAACARGDVVAAHDLLAKIKAGKVPDGFNPRDDVMRRSWSGLTTQEQVEGAIALLKKHGYVREVQTETTGRPRRSLIVHPSILIKPE